VIGLAVAGCGGDKDSDTDPPGGTARASELTECLTQADFEVKTMDNKEGSSRAFTVERPNGARTSYVYIFENPGEAKGAQKNLFEPKDEETVAAYTKGDTLVINTQAAADVASKLNACFELSDG